MVQTGAASGYNRVLRGGSWYDDANNATVCYRGYDDPYRRYSCLGFRLVRKAN